MQFIELESVTKNNILYKRYKYNTTPKDIKKVLQRIYTPAKAQDIAKFARTYGLSYMDQHFIKRLDNGLYEVLIAIPYEL